MNHVHIFEVTHRNGNGQTMNLCPDCAIKRRAAKRLEEPLGFNGRCDDCISAEQAAPGYVTPTAATLPTRPESFCPAPGWKPDPPMKPWRRPSTARGGQRPLADEDAA